MIEVESILVQLKPLNLQIKDKKKILTGTFC